jgi:hypothetical protein
VDELDRIYGDPDIEDGFLNPSRPMLTRARGEYEAVLADRDQRQTRDRLRLGL